MRLSCTASHSVRSFVSIRFALETLSNCVWPAPLRNACGASQRLASLVLLDRNALRFALPGVALAGRAWAAALPVSVAWSLLPPLGRAGFMCVTTRKARLAFLLGSLFRSAGSAPGRAVTPVFRPLFFFFPPRFWFCFLIHFPGK